MRNRTRTTAVGSALVGAGIALLAVSTPATAMTASVTEGAGLPLPPSTSPSASASASVSGTPSATASATASTTAAPSATATASTTAAPSATATPSGAPSASTTSSASPSPSPSCPPASSSSADPSASVDPSASGSVSASASASASPTGGILPSLLPPPMPRAAAQEPARDETSCRARMVSLTSNATQITAGNAPTLSGVVRDVNGDAVSGATVTIYAKSYGQSSYAAIATVKTDTAGQYRLVVRPTKQTAYGANVGDARSPVINTRVYTRVNVSSPAPGTRVGNPVTFRGALVPGYARVAVGLAYLVDGRFVVLAQADTGSTGGYSITARLPSGTHAFVVFTSAHQGSDRGAKSLTLTVP